MFICKYCGKEIKKIKGLNPHEIRCIKNINRIISGLEKFSKSDLGKKQREVLTEKVRGKNFEERYGIEKAKLIKEKLSNANKGHGGRKCKTYELELQRRKKISNFMLGNKHSKGRGIKVFYKNYWLRSTWEHKVALYLDSQNIIWDYEVCCYKISDISTYRPDFFIYNEEKQLIKIIEVKGYWYKNNKEKFEKFKEQNSNLLIELWDEKKLIDLDLLKKRMADY